MFIWRNILRILGIIALSQNLFQDELLGLLIVTTVIGSLIIFFQDRQFSESSKLSFIIAGIVLCGAYVFTKPFSHIDTITNIAFQSLTHACIAIYVLCMIISESKYSIEKLHNEYLDSKYKYLISGHLINVLPFVMMLVSQNSIAISIVCIILLLAIYSLEVYTWEQQRKSIYTKYIGKSNYLSPARSIHRATDSLL